MMFKNIIIRKYLHYLLEKKTNVLVKQLQQCVHSGAINIFFDPLNLADLSNKLK